MYLSPHSSAVFSNMADANEADVPPSSQGADGSEFAFVEPAREIFKPADIGKWEKSQSYHDLLGFITLLGDAVKGKKITTPRQISKACQKVIDIINCMDKWIDEIPAVDQPQRFGNKAFRDWYDRMIENAQSMIEGLLPEKFEGASIELVSYLKEGFGNKTRIDYGTGHEASFVLFLCCLYKLRIFQESDQETIVFEIFNKSRRTRILVLIRRRLFPRNIPAACRLTIMGNQQCYKGDFFTSALQYLHLMHRLQSVYRMEPAGSHGVWGLDDFQFLPFIWGAAQLIDHQHIFPKSFLKEEIVECFSKDYMFLDCIKFINKMKNGPFAEHSNTLWGISGVPNWSKVYSGLIKMYKKEVLSKFPIIQHFLFGTLMSIEPADHFKKPQ